MTDLSEILQKSNYPIAIGDIPQDTCFAEIKRFDEGNPASPGSLGSVFIIILESSSLIG